LDLYREILAKVLEQEKAEIYFPDLSIDATEIVSQKSYQTLMKISRIIRDDTLNDKDCYRKIEAIIQALEAIGSNGGSRHDE